MPIYAAKKSQDALSKRIPRNSKFDYIEPTIDTGASLSKRLKEWEEFREDYKIGKNELFKRIKPLGFVKLILHLAEMNSSFYTQNSIPKSMNNNSDSYMQADTNRSSFDKFVCGYGEMNKSDLVNDQIASNVQIEKKEILSSFKCPYLLLDVRLREEYELGHIIKAQSYPASMLGRSVNFESPDMLCYKNKPSSVIIVYDNDETLAPKVATTLVERGYENILMLSGGLKVCWKKFPHGLIAGKIPHSLQNVILSTCGMTNFQKNPYRRKKIRNDLETSSFNSENVDSLSRQLSRLSSVSPSQERLDYDDSRSTTSTARTNTSIRTNMSRYTSRRRFDIEDFEPYCSVNSRRRSDLNDQEEFTMEDLAMLSLALNDLDRMSTASTRASSCSTRNSSRNGVRQFKMK